MHPIRRRDTPSDRVQRDVTGAARRIGCSATDRVQRVLFGAGRVFRGCVAASDAAAWVCREGMPAVGLVVGGGAPDP